ncbi:MULTISPECIES: hypothetical protein [unclassified Bradyrhizobium]|uniref:hypothetical protein n=1 Tax=unclassified Bradyrhizobium TaxID=2631580 RepID=UPI0028EA8F71|nr:MULTISPECIES: hypothetical protein [unclassified Bradyrhizobium]
MIHDADFKGYQRIQPLLPTEVAYNKHPSLLSAYDCLFSICRAIATAMPIIASRLVTLTSLIGLSAVLGTSSASPKDRTHDYGPHLYEASQALMRAYNADDATAIQSMLSPKLAKVYDRPEIERVLSTCRSKVLPRIVRTSFPASGTRFYGFFAVYGEAHETSMILEIDAMNRIIFWAMADEVLDGDFRCALKKLD